MIGALDIRGMRALTTVDGGTEAVGLQRDGTRPLQKHSPPGSASA